MRRRRAAERARERLSMPGFYRRDPRERGNADLTGLSITSDAAFEVEENTAFAATLTANKGVQWTIVGGADQALFAVSADQLTMDAQDFEAPADADTDNDYIVTVRAAFGPETVDQTITVTVTDVAE